MGVDVHRRDDLPAGMSVRRRGVPATDVVRTLCDLGQFAPGGLLALRCEAVVVGGSYRLDFLPAPGLALEVDGFAYHASPAAKAADSLRRNRLQLNGLMVLQADWIEVQQHPERLRLAVMAGLALHTRSA